MLSIASICFLIVLSLESRGDVPHTCCHCNKSSEYLHPCAHTVTQSAHIILKHTYCHPPASCCCTSLLLCHIIFVKANDCCQEKRQSRLHICRLGLGTKIKCVQRLVCEAWNVWALVPVDRAEFKGMPRF